MLLDFLVQVLYIDGLTRRYIHSFNDLFNLRLLERTLKLEHDEKRLFDFTGFRDRCITVARLVGNHSIRFLFVTDQLKRKLNQKIIMSLKLSIRFLYIGIPSNAYIMSLNFSLLVVQTRS